VNWPIDRICAEIASLRRRVDGLEGFTPYPGPPALDDLTDVTAPAPITDQVLGYNGSVWTPRTLAPSLSGAVMGVKIAENTTEMELDTGLDPAVTIPWDGTVPEDDEGYEVLAVEYAATLGSLLVIDIQVPWYMLTSPQLFALALFLPSSTAAIAANVFYAEQVLGGTAIMRHVLTATTGDTIRYSVRGGPTGVVGALVVNPGTYFDSGVPFTLGFSPGKSKSIITITELRASMASAGTFTP